MFIVFYGINNIGKTYHAKRLAERLKKEGRSVRYVKYPIYSMAPTGPLLNSILRGTSGQKVSEEELQLLFVLNRYQFQPRLKQLLSKHTIVIAEDYSGTGIAWGVAKSKKRAKIRRELERMNTFLVQPDLSILLEGKRKRTSEEPVHIHEKNAALMERARRVFRSLGRRYKWKTVKVAKDKDVTAARVMKIVRSKLNY